MDTDIATVQCPLPSKIGHVEIIEIIFSGSYLTIQLNCCKIMVSAVTKTNGHVKDDWIDGISGMDINMQIMQSI